MSATGVVAATAGFLIAIIAQFYRRCISTQEHHRTLNHQSPFRIPAIPWPCLDKQHLRSLAASRWASLPNPSQLRGLVTRGHNTFHDTVATTEMTYLCDSWPPKPFAHAIALKQYNHPRETATIAFIILSRFHLRTLSQRLRALYALS